MKALKIIGIAILVLVILAGGFLAFGPSEGYLERSISINAGKPVILSDINNMKTFNKWSPWFTLDENATYEWSEKSVGVGASLTWYSEMEEVGNGSMEIVESSEDQVKYKMIFDQDQDGNLENNKDEPAFATLILEDQAEMTNVKWTFEIDNMTGFGKVFLLFLEGALGPFYEKGLKNLKERVEGRPEFSVDIAALEVDPVTFIGMAATSSSSDPIEIGNVMASAYGAVSNYLVKNGIEAMGYPLAVTTSYSESAIGMICGIPVDESTVINTTDLTLGKSYEGTVVKAVHMGDYSTLKNTHDQIDQYAKHYGLKIIGMPWEDYPTDPTMESDTSKWITNVYYPVQ